MTVSAAGILREYAQGTRFHRYQGECPDEDHPDDRDPLCAVCTALSLHDHVPAYPTTCAGCEHLAYELANRIPDASDEQERVDRLRLRLAQEALVKTGYFTADEVSDDVAPRIIELNSKHNRDLTHLFHCNFGEFSGTCKYEFDKNCPVFKNGWEWVGYNIDKGGAFDAIATMTREDDMSYSISIRSMPGHVGAGDDMEEAAAMAQDAALAWVGAARAQGDVRRGLDDEVERHHLVVAVREFVATHLALNRTLSEYSEQNSNMVGDDWRLRQAIKGAAEWFEAEAAHSRLDPRPAMLMQADILRDALDPKPGGWHARADMTPTVAPRTGLVEPRHSGVHNDD